MHSHSHPHSDGIVSKVALSSFFAALLLTTLKSIVGFQTHSLGILAEAAHSLIDLFAALITLWAVKVSAEPADQEHHFGHGKIENFSALIEVILLWITCIWICLEVFHRYTGKGHPEIEPNIWAFSVVLISIAVDFFRSRELQRVAKEHDSQALAADAMHFASDMYSSLAVLIGLIGVVCGFAWADAIAALGVAGWTFWISIKLVQEAFDQLMDKAPEGVEPNILKIMSEIEQIKQIPSLRVRKSGANLFVDLTVSLDKNMSFEEAHSITDRIEDNIRSNYSRAFISVHAEPV
ncbi:MAG: cation diffusion facilitator family transporter [Candidatus Melainabacteria bacterium]|jgi:cation diffusion facilitator family transporter